MDCAQYIWDLLEEKWDNEWEHDVGLWTWFAALYFEQSALPPKKPTGRSTTFSALENGVQVP